MRCFEVAVPRGVGVRVSSSSLSIAEIAQLVEHNLAKVGVASSSLVFRSRIQDSTILMIKL